MSDNSDDQQVTEQRPWQGQQPYISQALSEAQQQYNQGGEMASLTSDQLQAIRGVRSMNAQGQPIYDAAGNALQSAIAGESGAGLEEQIQAAIRPATQQYTEQTLPAIRGQAVETGNIGGSRQGVAEGIAARGYQDTVQDASTQITQNAADRALNAALATPQFAGAQQQQELQRLGALETQGQQLQALEQAMMDQERRDLERYAQLVAGNMYGQETVQPSGLNQPSQSQQAMGGAATGASIGAQMGGPYTALAGGAIGGIGGYLA